LDLFAGNGPTVQWRWDVAGGEREYEYNPKFVRSKEMEAACTGWQELEKRIMQIHEICAELMVNSNCGRHRKHQNFTKFWLNFFYHWSNLTCKSFSSRESHFSQLIRGWARQVCNSSFLLFLSFLFSLIIFHV
jgi:hypothetical protein